MLFSTNSKLAKDGIIKFSLPAVDTCIGAGKCRKFCYARKGTFNFKNVRSAHLNNLRLSNLHTFADMAVEELLRKRKFKILRIHDSGDFYCQDYLDKWVEIAKRVPEFKFYCYTKSFYLLDFSKFEALPNCKMIQSYGSIHDDKIDKNKPHAVVFESKVDLDRSQKYTDCSEHDIYAADKSIINIGLIKH